ncbi:MAG: hypothetical protein KVP17_001400 [Porospora cf. gigantea B]|uniref:uncharacterized protein n=1 Tax=Porospora cf. gigantea B TaxID=2853592 RepID=UPI003571E813|nr:MAG: hypothetical protein KVP17_001400 [Porospora cf. gigantea B]
MTFTLTALPYEKTALAPHISSKTLEYHHGKHHQAYVNKLNELTDNNKDGKTLKQIMAESTGVLFNQAGQVYNHNFYWTSLKPNPKSEQNLPHGRVAELISRDFGSFEEFKAKFSAAAGGVFGSGWAWLVVNDDRLSIVTTSNAANPLKEAVPLLTCDVWEHAYYLDYQNSRPQYVAAWWNLVNWDFANGNLEA